MNEEDIKKIEQLTVDSTKARLAILVRMNDLVRYVNNAVDSMQPLIEEVYRGTSYYHQFIRNGVDAKEAVMMLYNAMNDLSKALDISNIKNAIVIKSMSSKENNDETHE